MDKIDVITYTLYVVSLIPSITISEGVALGVETF
jgi:hypothetical protein